MGLEVRKPNGASRLVDIVMGEPVDGNDVSEGRGVRLDQRCDRIKCEDLNKKEFRLFQLEEIDENRTVHKQVLIP